MLGLFTALALLLAAVGVYGVISYWVTQRTHEFGIRMALGATVSDVLGLVLRQASMLIVTALLAGIILSQAANRVLASILFRASTTDLTVTVFAVILLSLIGLLAGYLPARRATRVNPVIALRYE